MNTIKYIGAGLMMVFMCACQNDESEAEQAETLQLAPNAKVDNISAKGGTFSVPVDWQKEECEVVINDAISGSPYIQSATPDHFGNTNGGGRIYVVFAVDANPTDQPRSQQITLKSITHGYCKTYTFTQAAKDDISIAATVTLNPTVTYQTIRGFGGLGMHSNWSTYMSNEEVDLAYRDDNGLRLSIMRVRIAPDKSNWSNMINAMKRAQDYGALLFATPWSPPASMKTNNDTKKGSLSVDKYADYAQWLCDFVDYMALNGVTVDAVSIQNEPDYQVDYESCDWTTTEQFNFVRDYGPTIQAKTKLICAESFNFNQSYGNILMDNPNTCSKFDIVGGHIYGNGLFANPTAQANGKEVWMTEHLLNDAWKENSTITPWDESMKTAREINQCLLANWHAYVWWHIVRYYSFMGDGEKGSVKGQMLPRGYVMSHFSKFIRPGDVRIEATDNHPNIELSAYQNDRQYVLILINTGTSEIGTAIDMPDNCSDIEAYTTDANNNRIVIDTETRGNQVRLHLAAKSISTIVIRK